MRENHLERSNCEDRFLSCREGRHPTALWLWVVAGFDRHHQTLGVDMSDLSSAAPERKIGKVTRVLGDYDFISTDDAPDQDVYFKTSGLEVRHP